MKPFPPSFRRLILLAMLLCVSACTVLQKDSPTAATTIQANSTGEIETAAITAFESRGFRWAGTTGGEVSFQRALSKSDELFYGTWGEEKSIERVVVRIIPVKYGTFRVSCFPYTIRQPNSGMEDVSRRMSLYSKTYANALNDIRRALDSR